MVLHSPDPLEKQFLFSIPLLFLGGSFVHFVYALSGKLTALGLFVPVNESVFEHLKLCLLPGLLWWLGSYLLHRRALFPAEWALAGLTAVLTAQLAVLMLFYTYTGMFGAHSLAADLFVFLIALCLGQGAGLLLYRRAAALPLPLTLALTAALFLLFALLTLFPPELPLFLDTSAGTYGFPRR